MKKTKIILALLGLTLILIAGMVTAQEPQPSILNRAVIKIDTLSCGGCFSTINAGLEQLEGYSGMGANLFRKLIAVDFSTPLTPEIITEKLSEVGYPGELESVEDITEKESFSYLESRRSKFGSAGGGCCSGGSLPGLTPQSGASCCTLPGVVNPTQNL